MKLGLRNTKLISAETKIISRWHKRIEYGYPTPFLNREELCTPLFKLLRERSIYSRGRFGAWKYEVSNQDHSFMQGVEAVDNILIGAPELTLNLPGVVNACSAATFTMCCLGSDK